MSSVLSLIRRFVFRATSTALTAIFSRGCSLRGVVVNRPSKFNAKTTFGEDCHVNGVWVDGGGAVAIGRGCHFGKGIKVFTQNHNYNSGQALPYDKAYVTKPVTFGDYVWVGSHAIILPGTTIEEGVIIQAGAVVSGRLEACGIYGGNPARKFASRDLEKYVEAKKRLGCVE